MPRKVKDNTANRVVGYAGPSVDTKVKRFFESHGFIVVTEGNVKHDPHFVIFDGGPDVHPFLYGDKVINETKFSMKRDLEDNMMWRMFGNLPKVGICRGAQFLNVMNGGFMFQDADGHTTAHTITDTRNNQVFRVTSTHHQMMVPNLVTGKVLAHADNVASYVKSGAFGKIKREANCKDAEVVWYESTGSLCVQYHPEYSAQGSECRRHFWTVYNETIGKVIAEGGLKCAA